MFGSTLRLRYVRTIIPKFAASIVAMKRLFAIFLMLITPLADPVAPFAFWGQRQSDNCANGCSGTCCCSVSNANHSCAVAVSSAPQYSRCATEQPRGILVSFSFDRDVPAPANLPQAFSTPHVFPDCCANLHAQLPPVPPDPPPRPACCDHAALNSPTSFDNFSL